MKDQDSTSRGPGPAAEDAALVERARSGDDNAFDLLVHRNQARVFGIAYHMLGHREDAEDVAQAVFLKAYRSLSNFQGRSAFSSWLHRITVNETFNFLKKRNRTRFLSLADLGPTSPDNPAHTRLTSSRSPDRDAQLKDLQKQLNVALQSLSHLHRTAVVLHDMEGMTHEEIARLLGCSVGTVRSRLFYARKQLQKKLAGFAL